MGSIRLRERLKEMEVVRYDEENFDMAARDEVVLTPDAPEWVAGLVEKGFLTMFGGQMWCRSFLVEPGDYIDQNGAVYTEEELPRLFDVVS